jgi:phage-related protein
MRMPGLSMALLVLTAGGCFFTLEAQEKKSPPPAKAAKPVAPPAHKPPPAKGPSNPAVRQLNEHPVQELDRFSKMSPEQQQKELAKLPPARRAAFEKNLDRYQKMTPAQQEHFKENLEAMRSLPKERQEAVKQQITQMRNMPTPELRRYVESEEFQKNFSPDEQKLIRNSVPRSQPKSQQDDL